MARLLALAEDGPGGLAALVAGDPETPDSRMAPTVLQLAPDSQVRHGIIANVVPLQITVQPRALSGADYDAIATLFTTADDWTTSRRTRSPTRCTELRPGFRRQPRWLRRICTTCPGPRLRTAAMIMASTWPSAPSRTTQVRTRTAPMGCADVAPVVSAGGE